MSVAQRISLRQVGVVMILASVALLASAVVPVEAGHIACGDTLGPGGSFTLDSNLGPCAGTALTLVGPVLLDMRGRQITCEDGGFGIDMQGRGAQLRNGRVEGCGTAISLAGSLHRVTRITVQTSAAATEVISEFSAGRNIFTDNTVSCTASPASRGFAIYGSLNTLTLNYVEGCDTAYFVRGSRNTLTRNDTDTGRIGYEIGGGSNTLTSNRADEQGEIAYNVVGERNILRTNTVGNDMIGIGFLADADLNQFLGNRSSTSGPGFVILSDRNRLIGNSIDLNSETAITVSGQSNLIQNNRASEPLAGPALVDTNPDCDANRWVNNTGSGNQDCVQ